MLKEKNSKSVELVMIPVLNVFLILIPFLLITAEFLHTAIIDISLPSQSRGRKSVASATVQTSPREQILILSIAPQGFYLLMGEKLIKIIPKGKEYYYEQLGEILQKVKKLFPDQQSIIIEADDSIVYDHIIHTMDQCRSCGLTNISLSASKN